MVLDDDADRFRKEHLRVTRRYFAAVGLTGWIGSGIASAAVPQSTQESSLRPGQYAGVQPDPYLTPQDSFRDVSRGKPVPHSLSEENRDAVGLTRQTWRLQVLSDPEHPATVGRQLAEELGTALTFEQLLQLGEKKSVRFLKVMTCLNLGCPLGMGLWEGVPLREVIWMTQPTENLRRVFYYGFHNDDPAQMFRSSLPIGRVLEDPPGLPPVVLCYKLNGEWLTPERGGPVRMVVPEAYGFKSIKWLSHVVLTNLPHANDTYAEQNNDVDSPLKTFAATLLTPKFARAGEAIPVSGYAQVGISGLSKVQVWVHSKAEPVPKDDPWFTEAPWTDADILAAPANWNDDFGAQMPAGTFGFDEQSRPLTWPMRLTNAHWATVLPGLPAGEYTLRCRSIDGNGMAQPMPRPFRKSGHAAIEAVGLTVID